jgi:thioesterase domain-containing protein
MMGNGTRGSPAHLEAYLHEHIPISAAMGVRVKAAADDEVRLQAPLDRNINHRSTVFGGSAAAVAILAGWSLLHVRLGHSGHGSRIVIQRSSIDYTHPIEGDFEAVALAPRRTDWERFVRTLTRRGRGRIELVAELRRNGSKLGECTGTYVVLPPDTEEEDESAVELLGHALR